MFHTPQPRPRLIAGAMSGTSADGVDVAITRIHGTGLAMRADLVRHHHRPYDRALRNRIFALRASGQTTLADLARLARDVSLAYSHAVNDALRLANLTAPDLTAVAAHGQTLYHAPPDTIQCLDPALIAADTLCAVVSDFRRADCAAGGQGAPLVPFADHILFRHPTRHRILLNLGGIANLTYVPPGGTLDNLLAFDVGPANCLSDDICRRADPTGPGYDPGGATAQTGTAHVGTASAFARNPYVSRKPPKSTDGPDMIAAFSQAKQQASFAGSLADEVATAALAVALSLETSLDLFLRPWREWPNLDLLIAGGGTQNATLMKRIRDVLTTGARLEIVPLDSTLAQAKEALAFALLAAATLDDVPSNVPTCTGATRPAVLGSITPRPQT
jgi:anhydro-N-acetylmuramic acid kinase